jgi:GIY-YIG catalytic domain
MRGWPTTRVCWYPCDEPWAAEAAEAAVIGSADLPLNLDQNRAHPFHARLTAVRSAARRRARELPVVS